MFALLRAALTMVAVFTLLLGIVAPLAVTGIAGLAFAHEARGSLIQREAPPALPPMPGISTSTRSAMHASRIGAASLRQKW